MSRPFSAEQFPQEFGARSPGNFNEIRLEVAHRLFRDPSYGVFDAMSEMSETAEAYISKLAEQHPGHKLWVGGSLGRREMLPNSDIDLFVIYDSQTQDKSTIRVDNVDKFELGHIDTESLRDLLRYSLVDANRFIDGRSIGSLPAPDVDAMILEANTSDHQLANNISEYFFYRHFDFPNKTTAMGPNLKYSTGSSRDTIFFNMISRMTTGNFPAIRNDTPELANVMADAERRYGVAAPYNAVNLLFTVKNAAISVYDVTGDPRNRYVSSTSLEAIYDFCRDKFKALGIQDSTKFISTYRAAREELELAVDTLLSRALAEHPASSVIRELLAVPKEEKAAASLRIINSSSEYPHALAAFSVWHAAANDPKPTEMNHIAQALMTQPLDQTWGALMGIACSSLTPDTTLSQLADWLYTNEKGAYLTKLISRNPAASSATRAKALQYYKTKEIIT